MDMDASGMGNGGHSVASTEGPRVRSGLCKLHPQQAGAQILYHPQRAAHSCVLCSSLQTLPPRDLFHSSH